MKITIIGLDLAKSIFYIVACDKTGKEIYRKKLRRAQMLAYFAQLEPCIVAMEACSGAHYWARELTKLGHDAREISPQHVKPYLTGQKNDYNDAAAIAETASRPKTRYVAIKTTEQQDMQALYRMRKRVDKDRSRLVNQTRGILSEFGIVIAVGISQFRKRLPDILEDASNGLSDRFRRLLSMSYAQLLEQDASLQEYNKLLTAEVKSNPACQQLLKIPGYGPVNSSAFASYIGHGQQYRRGRDASASLGVIPRQNSSGGKTVLLGITKKGDCYLRSLIVHGARSVVSRAKDKDDKLSQWINHLVASRGYNKAVVAYANKMIRMGWAVIRYNEEFDLRKAA